MSAIEPWKKVGSVPRGDFGIFTIRSDRRVSPRTGREHDFYVIECVDWVNVIALTPDQQVVMVEQFRHGSNTVELEIPGGMIDAGDASPEAAAQRELREETGYAGQNARVIGRVFPNPAIMSNVCFTVLIENCRCLHPIDLDGTEDLLTKLVPMAELPALVASGKVRHSLVAAALYHFDLSRRADAKIEGPKNQNGVSA
jgi:8-oxo-dGTP pyrophosphatase MutT (NUDIX family)